MSLPAWLPLVLSSGLGIHLYVGIHLCASINLHGKFQKPGADMSIFKLHKERKLTEPAEVDTIQPSPFPKIFMVALLSIA